MELSIIIISFNTRNLLETCLNSLFNNLKDLDYEIIVVDNASADGTIEMLERFRDRISENIVLIFNKENIGFAKANNQGINVSKGDFVLLLNSDTELIDSSVSDLLKFARKTKNFGAGGPLLLNSDKTPQASVFSDQSISNAFKEFWLGEKGKFMLTVPKNLDLPQTVYGVIGAALLIPRKVFENVGLLDDSYFFYYEDLDYCRRVRKFGYKVFYFPLTKIIHHHGASSNKNPEQSSKSLIRGSKKYNGLLKYTILYFILWSGQKIRKLLGK